ncbi:MAG TPA: hypothetical protein VE959_04400 [Bryobacteraceae bacterium]|nr:hypothetical protein [Bryobacteraceae bacterium]
MKRIFTFAASLLLVSVWPVRADIQLIYTGAAFNQFYGSTGDTTANYISVTMTLANPLLASTSGNLSGDPNLEAWSITDPE